MHAAIAILFILICIMLIGIVLLQKGRGGGLSGAFGGGGAHSAFGARTGDTFTWITVVLVGLFLLVAMVATASFKPDVDAPVGEEAVALAETPAETPASADESAEAPATEEAAAVDAPAADAPTAEAPAEAPADAPADAADEQ